MSNDIEVMRLRAEASFMTALPSAGPMSAQDAMLRAVQEKTARLKALRLAKEKADREAAAATGTLRKRAKRADAG